MGVDFTCEFCTKTFRSEKTFHKHCCERKRRWLERDQADSRLAFSAFCKFWELNHRTSRARTWDDFSNSAYYGAFKRWGIYCVNLRAVNTEAYLRWLLKSEIAIDRWCKDEHYTNYLIDYLTVEAITDALTRGIETSVEWAESTGMIASDILRYANTSRLIQLVVTGRLSPWLIYSSTSGQHWLEKLNSAELALIWPYINVERWNKILLDREEDREYTRSILLQAGW